MNKKDFEIKMLVGKIDALKNEIEELKIKRDGKKYSAPKKVEKVRDKVYERTRKSHKSK